MGRTTFAVAVCLLVAGCSGAPKCKERGWVGGCVTSVHACAGFLEAPPPSCSSEKVVGMPRGVGSRRGLLVTRVTPGSPLALAGFREGDLILAMDGRHVRGPLDFRRRVEEKRPGSTAVFDVWRDGALAHREVPVGRETYQQMLTIGIGILPSPRADLWPFDDGIDVFGIVAAKNLPARRDIASPERAYLAKAVPGGAPARIRQESTWVTLFPLTVGLHHEVQRQEAVLVASR
jgi:hypothetical protein